MSKIKIRKTVYNQLSSIINKAEEKVRKEIIKLQNDNIIGDDLFQIAIDNLKKKNPEVNTLNDFREYLYFWKNSNNYEDLPDRLKSKYPIIDGYKLDGKSTPLFHGHIYYLKEFYSIFWCKSNKDNSIILVLLLERHPKENSQGYNKVKDKLPKKEKDMDFIKMDKSKNIEGTSIGYRQSIQVYFRNNLKELKLNSISTNKNAVSYTLDNKIYLVFKINNSGKLENREQFLYISLDKSELNQNFEELIKTRKYFTLITCFNGTEDISQRQIFYNFENVENLIKFNSNEKIAESLKVLYEQLKLTKHNFTKLYKKSKVKEI